VASFDVAVAWFAVVVDCTVAVAGVVKSSGEEVAVQPPTVSQFEFSGRRGLQGQQLAHEDRQAIQQVQQMGLERSKLEPELLHLQRQQQHGDPSLVLVDLLLASVLLY
jgi:hypothetical protein